MLEARGIAVRYGALEAVRAVSFTVDEGRIVALIGANGAGKSTTLKALMGLLPLAGGDITWRGRPIGHIGSVIDITERKLDEKRRALLIRELNHRKNSYQRS